MPSKKITCPECREKIRGWKRFAEHLLIHHGDYTGSYSICYSGRYNVSCWCGEYFELIATNQESLFHDAVRKLHRHLQSIGRDNIEQHYVLSKLGRLSDA